VYLTFNRSAGGDRLYQALLADKASINDALGVPVDWHYSAGKGWIVAKKSYDGTLLTDHRADIRKFMRDRINRFVNVFRPRVRQLVDEGVVSGAS
jgi:hypothetical protein